MSKCRFSTSSSYFGGRPNGDNGSTSPDIDGFIHHSVYFPVDEDERLVPFFLDCDEFVYRRSLDIGRFQHGSGVDLPMPFLEATNCLSSGAVYHFSGWEA
jgi:hypothetical protein